MAQYLFKRGRAWSVRRAVPERLRPLLGGRREIVVALGTRDYAEACRRRHAALAQIEAELARASAELSPLPRAERYYRALQRLSDDPRDARGDGHTPRQDLLMQAADEAEEIAEERGEEMARQFLAMVRTGERSLETLREEWLQTRVDGVRQPRTALQYRRDTGAALEALRRRGILQASGVTRRVAGEVVDAAFAGGPKTVNRKLSAVSSWWRWLIRRGHAETNPWSGQGAPAEAVRDSRGAEEARLRPYQPGEVVALLGASRAAQSRRYRTMLWDIQVMALCTGARLEELCRLRGEDLVGGRIRIRQGKTRAAVRQIPPMPEVAAIIARRGPAEGEWLFPELEASGIDHKRSESFTKAYTRFRRSVLGEGSPTDFHSWRRTFATYGERAGVHGPALDTLMGHAHGNLALDVYSGGLTWEGLARAVAEIRGVIEPEVLAEIGGGRSP